MLSLDEAIQYAENLGTEEENKIDYDKDSPHMIICRKNTVKDYRQLAEWLTELKELRSITDACNILAVDVFAVEKLCKELKEAKRLLKAATNVLNMFIPCDEDYCSECIKQRQNCDYDDSFKWRYADEALALIGEEGENNA